MLGVIPLKKTNLPSAAISCWLLLIEEWGFHEHPPPHGILPVLSLCRSYACCYSGCCPYVQLPSCVQKILFPGSHLLPLAHHLLSPLIKWSMSLCWRIVIYVSFSSEHFIDQLLVSVFIIFCYKQKLLIRVERCTDLCI